MTKARDTASLVSSQTGIAVTISGDPVILGVGNTELVRVTGAGNIGIGTTNPGVKLMINDNVSQVGYSTQIPNATSNVVITNTAGDACLNLLNDDRTTGPVANNGAFIRLNGKYSTLFPASNRTFGAIGAFKENGTAEDQQGYLALYSRPSSGSALERVRVTSGGAVGIGTTQTSGYTVYIRGTANNANPTHGSVNLYGSDYAYIGLSNSGDSPPNNWFIGHLGGGSPDVLAFRYGTGPASGTGSLYLHNTHMVSVGSAVTTGTANQTFQVMNGGGYFANHLSVGTTGNYQTFSLYGNQWMNGNTYITWNQGDVIVQGLNIGSGYGISISSYNATMNRMVPSIVSSGANKCVGINTTATLSSFGLVVQKENGNTFETGITGAIYARGSIYSYAGQYLGGLGSMTTAGTTNWNDATNARSGMGYTLLAGNATNGPTGIGDYYHAISFEYSSKDGSGNLTQLAIPYYGSGLDVYYRTRYSGTWSSWTAV
jgi:hypothetical protein